MKNLGMLLAAVLILSSCGGILEPGKSIASEVKVSVKAPGPIPLGSRVLTYPVSAVHLTAESTGLSTIDTDLVWVPANQLWEGTILNLAYAQWKISGTATGGTFGDVTYYGSWYYNIGPGTTGLWIDLIARTGYVPMNISWTSPGVVKLTATASRSGFSNQTMTWYVTDTSLSDASQSFKPLLAGLWNIRIDGYDGGNQLIHTGVLDVTVAENQGSPLNLLLTSMVNNNPPGPVTALSAQAGDTLVTLTWTDPPDSDLDYIIISWGAGAGESLRIENAVGTASISGLTNGTIYTFTLTAYDSVAQSSTVETVQAQPQSITAWPTAGVETLDRLVPDAFSWINFSGESFVWMVLDAPYTGNYTFELTDGDSTLPGFNINALVSLYDSTKQPVSWLQSYDGGGKITGYLSTGRYFVKIMTKDGLPAAGIAGLSVSP